ncbi:Kunitz/Bovine pancreatic trypsin inhibitor domain protein, partial [Ostertagia ostertagi]
MNKSLYLKQEGSVINAPPVRVPDKRPRKLQELSERLTTNEYPEFLRAPPPNSTRTRPTHTLNQVNPIQDAPYDNFPKHMQHFNITLTDPNTNQAPNDPANHPMRLNIQPIRSFTGIISDDDDEEEDSAEEIPRRAAGVAQAHAREPIGLEHFHAPSPSFRGAAHPQAIHGKKIAKIPAIHMDGLSTSSTEVFEDNQDGLARTDRPQTITGQRVSRITLRPHSTTEAPHPPSTTSRSSTVTAVRSTSPSSTTTRRTPRTESTTTANADELQSSTVATETSYGTTPEGAPLEGQAPLETVSYSSTTEANTSETDAYSDVTQTKLLETTTAVGTESTTESLRDYSSTLSSHSTSDSSSSSPLPTDGDVSEGTYLPTTAKSTNAPLSSSTSSSSEPADEIVASDEGAVTSVSLSAILSTTISPASTDSGVTVTSDVTSDTFSTSTAIPSHAESTTSTSEETTVAPISTDSSTTVVDSSTASTTLPENPHTKEANIPHQSLGGSDNTIDHDAKTSDDEHTSEEEIEFFDPNNLPPPPPENDRRPPMKIEQPHLYGETIKALKKVEILPKSIITGSAPTFTASSTDSTIQSTTVDPTLAENGDSSPEHVPSHSSFEMSSSEDMAGYSVGREPVPLSPVGIGRNMERLDIDGLAPVPTTASPSTTHSATAPPVPRAIAPARVQPPEQREFDARVCLRTTTGPGSCVDVSSRWSCNAISSQCEQFCAALGRNENIADRVSMTGIGYLTTESMQLRARWRLGKVTSQVYFNMKNLRCEQFVYEGRGGNDNQFDTLSDCERYCAPQPGPHRYVTQPPTTSARPPAPAPAPAPAPQQSLRPIAAQPLPDRQTIDDILDYDEKLSQFIDKSDSSTFAPASHAAGNSIDNRAPSPLAPAPQVPASVLSPGAQPRPPAVQAAKTVVHRERTPEKSAEKAAIPEQRKEIYKAEPLPSKPPATGNENLPIVGPSPPMSVNYQTGEVLKISESSLMLITKDIQDLTEAEEERRDALSCPNGLQELRYADGRPVMCLPGKNQCPEKSSCYFNGVDFFCCPNEEDPYDKHVFGGYDGEETKHGYKVFGPLNIRRLMDEVPLRVRRDVRSVRARRQASDSVFSSGPAAFNIDSITAPLRFDDEKPRTVSRAQRMRAKPSPPHHGNPICIEPLATGDCDAAHL